MTTTAGFLPPPSLSTTSGGMTMPVMSPGFAATVRVRLMHAQVRRMAEASGRSISSSASASARRSFGSSTMQSERTSRWGSRQMLQTLIDQAPRQIVPQQLTLEP